MALTEAEIKKFISDDISSHKKQRAKVGLRYYNGEHDILKKRLFYYNSDGNLVEDTTRSNIKISHPFFTELTEQLSSHLLSFTENPIRAKENAEGLQTHLDLYFNSRFWGEIGDMVEGGYSKGFEYLYAYKNKYNRLAFQCADSMGVIEIEAKKAEDNKNHVLRWYIDSVEKGKKVVKKIQDWMDDGVIYYIQENDSKIEPDKDVPINPRPHVVFTKGGEKRGYNFGFIPFFRYDNNKKQFSGLKPIKALIDDYDLHACSLSNNLVDFDTPLYCVSGFEGNNLDELQQNLKTKKMVGVDSEGGISVQTVDIPYQARKEKLELDERNIYKFGMGFNSSQTGDGNITNIVIRSRYTLLDLKTDRVETRLCSMLEDDIIPLVLDEINAVNKTGFTMEDIKIVFERDTMTNETENIQNDKTKAETQQIRINTILNVAVNIGDEETLKAICDELDLDFEDVKKQAEQLKDNNSTADARALLGGVVTDEPKAEDSSGTISE